MFKYLLKRNIKTGVKALAKKHRSFLNFDSIQRVLIFFDSKNWDSIAPIVNDLKQNGKKVILWTFGDTNIQYPENVKIVDQHKDTNWMKALKPEVYSEFNSLEYDTFWDLSFDKNIYLLLLKVKNSSKFAIGFEENEYKLYDFILFKEEDKTLFETYQQAKIYLKNNT